MPEYTLAEFLIQIQKLARPGQLRDKMMKIPGMSRHVENCNAEEIQLDAKRMTGIVDAMTQVERKTPEIIGTERSERIARGSGTSRQSVCDLVRQFRNMRSTMIELSDTRRR